MQQNLSKPSNFSITKGLGSVMFLMLPLFEQNIINVVIR